MADTTKAPPAPEISDFLWFLEHKVFAKGRTDVSLDQAVLAYRDYRAALERMEKEIAPALASLDRGEGTMLDFGELRDRLERIVQAAEAHERCRSS